MPFLKSVNFKGSLALAIGCWYDYDHFFHGNGCFLQTEKKKIILLLSRDTTDSV